MFLRMIGHILVMLFGVYLTILFTYIALRGSILLGEQNLVILYAEIAMAVVIAVFGFLLLIREIRG